MYDDIQEQVRQMIYAVPYQANPTPEEIERLSSLPADIAVAALKTIFAHEHHPTIRGKAFGALLAVPSHDRVQFLLDRYETRSVDWQIAICEALGQLPPDDRSLAKVSEIARWAADPDLRFVAVEVLGTIGDHRALATLQYVARHDTGKDYEGFSIAKEARLSQKKIQARLKHAS